MKTSLKKRTVILIAVISIIICASAFLVIRKGIGDVVKTLYKEKSIDISEAIAVYMNEDRDNIRVIKDEILKVYNNTENKVTSDKWGTPEFEEYLSKYTYIQDMPEFKEVVERLRKIQDVLDIDCAYLTMIDGANLTDYYIADAAYEYACPPGMIDPIYNIENSPLVSGTFAPNITNTEEYGWLITTGMPILEDNGDTLCYAAIDISMNEIMVIQNKFLSIMALAFTVLCIVLIIIAVKIVEKTIVTPIKDLSTAASHYVAGEENFKNVEIHTGDEIEDLLNSVKKMDEDVNDYIGQLVTAQQVARQMEEAANIDALTKVRNKRAYDIKLDELKEETQPYAIAMIDLNDLKHINDKYGHDKGDIALKSICHIICKTFKHSPVFRVGGDEFVVLLQCSDFEERKSLLKEFENTTKELSKQDIEPWEKVSAAWGVHVAKKGEAPEEVFKRADNDMYQRKVSMKK